LKKIILYSLFVLLLFGCRATRIPEPLPEVHMRVIVHKKDTALRAGTRYVFSRIPCDSVRLTDARGKIMPMKTESTDTNKLFYYCDELDKKAGMMVPGLTYKNENISMTIYMDGSINLNTARCGKYLYRVIEKWGDSIPVVVWTEVHEKTGSLHIYLAEESYTYPYYKDTTLDSLVFKFSEICSAADIKEEKKSLQAFYEKYLRVKVTPNPYTENFELILKNEKMPPWLVPTSPMNIGFFDDRGNPLLTQPIEIDKTYIFSLPDILPGKTIYYRITWDDYIISGQILKN
jgi:hypothetical protein